MITKKEQELVQDKLYDIEQKPISVGEEFVEWAEKHHSLKEKYDVAPSPNSEACPYEYIKDTFVRKINEVIKCRLG